jgi:hypothetical protein
MISLFLALFVGCRDRDTDDPLEFKAYEHNPILTPGAPDSWDDLYVINAFEIEEMDTIYLFYTAYSQVGTRALGLASSTDGYHFTKFEGNPILTGDKEGYDAFGVAQASLLKEESGWVLYFNAREIAGFSSGPFIGRATSPSIKGPWSKREQPVLVSGRLGEWDSEFIYLGTVLSLNGNGYVMYYGGGTDMVSQKDFFIGMATSADGIHWKKYNNPLTTKHPYADSDPVMMNGNQGEWDEDIVLPCMVLKQPDGYRMYYSCDAFGYATSIDGICWEKYPGNPVYTLDDDPNYHRMRKKDATMQGAKLLFRDSLCYMYYDYGHSENSAISMAIAKMNK